MKTLKNKIILMKHYQCIILDSLRKKIKSQKMVKKTKNNKIHKRS